VNLNGVLHQLAPLRRGKLAYLLAATLLGYFRPMEASREDSRARRTSEIWSAETRTEQSGVPFPEIKDWSSLRMTLERGECYGACPLYTVEVRGSGEVVFRGREFVLVPGQHRTQISREAVEKLIGEFRKTDYFSLRDRYAYAVTDAPRFRTEIEFDGRKKSVVDYVGAEVGMPKTVTELEDAFDEIAKTRKWVEGNGETRQALIAEGWNFAADSEDNRKLLANAVASGQKDLIAAYFDQPHLAAGLLACGLESAAGRGDLAVVERFFEKGADPKNPVCSRDTRWTVLMRAVESGKADVIREILRYYPEVNAKDDAGRTALALFVEQSHPNADTAKIIEMLVRAGADVNSRDDIGKTPIFSACNNGPEFVRALVEAKADLNVKDQNNMTALMYCFDLASIKEMIDAGADLDARGGPYDQTAAEQAANMHANDKAALLEAAMKARDHR
jgi:ankyrin repeat protein